MATFKICVIGCGGIATGYHGPSYNRYAATHPDTDLTACCDVDAPRAEKFRARFGFARAYTDAAYMLDVEQPDVTCLAVPPDHTCALGCLVLQRGLALLTEKPPGLTIEEVDRLIAAADNSTAPHRVAFNRRYTPLVQRLKQLLAQYCPDGIQQIRYDFTRVGRTDVDFSTTAIHGIDTVRYISGSDYAQVRFEYQSFPELGPNSANISMACTLTSGATAQLNFHPVSGVVTERATVHAHDHTFFLGIPVWNGFDAPGRVQHLHKGTLMEDESGPDVSGSSEGFILNGFYGENESFFDDLRAGRRPGRDLRSARQSVEVAQCIRERRNSLP
jgi:predicted dehydrogenase